MRRAALAALMLATASVAGAQEGGGFVSGVEDLPLMAGLREMTDLSVVFDKPEGRIVDAFAIGKVEPGAVRRFYAETLPQLGWEALAPASYRREGERLTIVVKPETTGVTVRFSILPE